MLKSRTLLPVEAIYGSLAITDDLTLGLITADGMTTNLTWRSLFGVGDTFTRGTKNGNGGRYFIGGGSYSGAAFACDAAALAAAGLAASAALSTYSGHFLVLVMTLEC